MAPEDERDLIEAVVTCEGNLHDPDFSDRFQSIVNNLKSILYTTNNKPLKVRKIEPWNSVRVTISIPKEAAQRLRLLAQQGSNVLRQLGILSVQVEGDQVISLTLAGRFNEPQEVILRQSNESTNAGSSPSTASTSSLCSSSSSASSSTSSSVPLPIVPTAGPSGVMVSLDVLSSSSSSAFRSPNVVAPSGESIPFPPKNVAVGPRPPLGGPFPFASMTHAAHTMQRSETTSSNSNNSTQISASVTNSTNSNSNTSPSSNNANTNATTTSHVTAHAPCPSPVVIPVSVTNCGPHGRNSNSSTSKVNVTVSPSATPPPVPTATILTTPATTLSAPVRKNSNSNNNNNLNSPNVNVVTKPQPVLVTAVVNAKSNSNNNSSNSNSGSSSQHNSGSSNISNSSFIPPSNPPNVVVVVNNTNFSKPAQVQGDAKLNPSQHVQHLQHPHHHSKLQTVLKASAGMAAVLSPSLSLKDKAHESILPHPPPVTAAVVAIAGGNPQLTSTGKPRQFLINPLTGHLEPMPSESSSDSEGEDEEHHKRTGSTNKPNKVSHSHLVKSLSKGKDNPTVNAAGWDKLSLPPPKPVKITLESLKFNRFIQATPPSGSAPVLVSRKSREDNGSGPSSDTITHTSLAKENHSVAHHLNNASTPSTNNPVDKIKKLRLKLEKGESLSPASYKMDVSYVKRSEKSSLSTGTSSSSLSGASSVTMAGQFTTGSPSSTGSGSGGYHHHTSSSQSPPVSSQSDVPRVPPLHISLRGKNAAVVVSPRRDDSLKDLPSGVMSSSTPSVLTSNSVLNEKLIVSVNPSKTSSSTSMAIKRTKIRLKSSDGSSSHGDSRSASGESKKAGKNFQSRPSVPTQLQSSLSSRVSTPVSAGNVSAEEREDPLKARLKSEDKFNSASSTLSEFGKGKSASVSDLISGNPATISSVNAMSAATLAGSSLSSATLLPVKVKKHRRKSELVPSSRQVFIPSQSHDREIVRPPHSVTEASQLMKLLSQQVVKEEGGVQNLPVVHAMSAATTLAPNLTSPIFTTVASTFAAPVTATDVVVVKAVVESSPISCDNDKDRDRSSSTVVLSAPSLQPQKVSVAVEIPTTTATTSRLLPVVSTTPTSLFTLDNKDNDNSPLKEPTEQNPMEKNSTRPVVLVKASDIPKHDQGSLAQTNELEITTPTAIPDLKLSRSPYSNKALPDLLALPFPSAVVSNSNVSDVRKSEVTASSQSLIFSLSSQLPPQPQPQLKHHHPPPSSLSMSLVSKDSPSSEVPTLPVVSASVPSGSGGAMTTPTTATTTTQSAIVVSRSVSELVMTTNSKTSSTGSGNSSNVNISGSLQKHQQQLHTHSQLVKPTSSTSSSAANSTAATTTIALAISSSVQSVGSSILNQMLTGKDSLQIHSQPSVCGTDNMNPHLNPNPKTTSLSDFSSNLTVVKTPIIPINPTTSNPTTPSVLIARVQNLPPRVTPTLSSSSASTSTSLDVDNKNPVTDKPSIVKLVSGKGPELMETTSISNILTQQERFRHHVGIGSGVGVGHHVNTINTLNSMDVDMEGGRKVLSSVAVKEKEVTLKAQLQLEPQPCKTAPLEAIRLEDVHEKVQLSSPICMSMNVNNNKNEPVLEPELLESDREDVRNNSNNNSPATVMAAPNVSVSSPSNSQNTLSMDPLPLRLMALSLPPLASAASSLTLITTSGGNMGSGKPEDHSSSSGGGGIPGEDSGIDSMDALSEKSPNQGESPARKNENDHQFCDNSSASHQPPQHQAPLALHHQHSHPHPLQHPHPQKSSPLREQSVSIADRESHLQQHVTSLSSTISSSSEPNICHGGEGDLSICNVEQSTDIEVVAQSDSVVVASASPPTSTSVPDVYVDEFKDADVVVASDDSNVATLPNPIEDTPLVPKETIVTVSTVLEVPIITENLDVDDKMELIRATEQETVEKEESESSPVRNQVPLSLPSASTATDLVASISSISSTSSTTVMNSATATTATRLTTTTLSSTLTSQLSCPSAQQQQPLPLQPESVDTEMFNAIADSDTNTTATDPSNTVITTEPQEPSSVSNTNRTDFDTSTSVDNVVNINNKVNCDNNMENILSEFDNDKNDNASEGHLQPEVLLSQSPVPRSPIPSSCPSSPAFVNGNLTSNNTSDKVCDDNETTRIMESPSRSSSSPSFSVGTVDSDLPLQSQIQPPPSPSPRPCTDTVHSVGIPEEPLSETRTRTVSEDLPIASTIPSPVLEVIDGDVEMTDVGSVSQCTDASVTEEVGFSISNQSGASDSSKLDSSEPSENNPNLKQLLVPDNSIENEIQLQKQTQIQPPRIKSITNTSVSVNLVKLILPTQLEIDQRINKSDDIVEESIVNTSEVLDLDNGSEVSLEKNADERAQGASVGARVLGEQVLSENESLNLSETSSSDQPKSLAENKIVSLGVDVSTSGKPLCDDSKISANSPLTPPSCSESLISPMLVEPGTLVEAAPSTTLAITEVAEATILTSVPVVEDEDFAMDTDEKVKQSASAFEQPVDVQVITSATLRSPSSEISSQFQEVSTIITQSEEHIVSPLVVVPEVSAEVDTPALMTPFNVSEDANVNISIPELVGDTELVTSATEESIEPSVKVLPDQAEQQTTGAKNIMTRSKSPLSSGLTHEEVKQCSDIADLDAAKEKSDTVSVVSEILAGDAANVIPTTIAVKVNVDTINTTIDRLPLESLTVVPTSLELVDPVSAPVEVLDAVPAPIKSLEAIPVPVELKGTVSAPLKPVDAIPAPVESKSTVSIPVKSNETVPATSESKDAVPPLVKSKETVPVPISSKDAVLAPVESKHAVPVPVESKNAVPASVESKDAGPAPVESKNVAPVQVESKDAVPAPVESKGTVPAPVLSTGTISALAESKDTIPALGESMDTVPAPMESKDAIPAPVESTDTVLAPVESVDVIPAPMDSVDVVPAPVEQRTLALDPEEPVVVGASRLKTLTVVTASPVPKQIAPAPLVSKPFDAAPLKPITTAPAPFLLKSVDSTQLAPKTTAPAPFLLKSVDPAQLAPKTASPGPFASKSVDPVPLAPKTTPAPLASKSVDPPPLVPKTKVPSLAPVIPTPIAPVPIVSQNRDTAITDDKTAKVRLEKKPINIAAESLPSQVVAPLSVAPKPLPTLISVVKPGVVKSSATGELDEVNAPDNKSNASLCSPIIPDSRSMKSASVANKKELVLEPELPPTEKITDVNLAAPAAVPVVKPSEPSIVPAVVDIKPTAEEPTTGKVKIELEPKVEPVHVTVASGSTQEGVKKPVSQNRTTVEVKPKIIIVPTVAIPSKSESLTTNTNFKPTPVPASVSPSVSIATVSPSAAAVSFREKQQYQQPSESLVKVPFTPAKIKEAEEVKVRIKVDASTSTRSTSMAATAIIYPSKAISSNVTPVLKKEEMDKEKPVEAPVVNVPATQPSIAPLPNHPVVVTTGGTTLLATSATPAAVPLSQSHPPHESLNSKDSETKQHPQQLLQPKMTPSPVPNLSQVPPRSSRKDNIQHPLPILIPAPNQTPRESHSFQAFNVQQGSKPQMPSIAPMHKMKISPEATDIHNSLSKGSPTTTSVSIINANASTHVANAINLDAAHASHSTPSSNSGPSPLPPILIRPNFQQSFQQFQLDSQHKPISIQQQNLQNRHSIEISLPSKMEVKPSVNINVARGVVPNVIQLTKASAVNLSNRMPIAVTAAQCHSVTKASPISVSLSPLTGSAALGNTSGTPTVFAIHPQYHHHQSGITVLPSGHKMVPIKLVTIPKQNQAQLPLQTMVGSNRSSPTILETVNIVTAASRSGSPISGGNKSKGVVHGNPVQTSPLNLTSVTSGNLHLVPISVASATASGTSSPVKVLVSSPKKMQPNLLQSMMVQGQIVMANQNQSHPATIRVVRPIMSHNLEPPKLEPIGKHIEREEKTVKFEAYLPTLSSSVVQHIPDASLTSVAAIVPDKNSIYENVDGVEVLETEDANEDDLYQFEADIIHDEKDLADVLADEKNVGITENGIGLGELDDPYDIDECVSTMKANHDRSGSKSPTDDSSSADADIDKGMDSPIPAMRASSPLYTYSNRSGRNSHSASESRSPSPPEPDVHGEDQEIIDCLSRSPSQPKLSPQNKPLSCLENDTDQDNDYGSPTKPELHPDHTYVGSGKRGENCSSTSSASSSAPQLEQLSIEIPPVDLMAMSPAATEENRKSTRNTRSNTRLVSPDITAFRSDTPKPTKFTNKPDALILRNSPKPSPTGSIKTHSPGLVNIQPSTSTRSSPIPNQLSVNINSGLHQITGRNSPSLVASSLAMSLSGGRVGSGGLAGTAFINKRKRQESDSSNASKDENSEENKIDIDLNSRPVKRRCSENAAELIKACIGVEDTPKRNSSLIKKMELQDTKAKDAATGKGKKPIMSVVVEENEEDLESVDLLNRGRGGGRSSRGSSEDRSSSRGSSVHRNTVTTKPTVKESGNEEHKDQKTNSRVNNRTVGSKDMTNKSKVQSSGRDSPNPNSHLTKKDDKAQSAVGRRSNRNAPTKEKSPLTLAKTRTNVRKEPVVTGGTEKATTPSTSPENGNPRRKTRSSVAVGMSDSSMPSFKRRRISKDAKS